MKHIIGLVASAVCAWSSAAIAAEEGSWTLRPAEAAGQVHFTVLQQQRGGTSHSSSDWPLGAFEGLDFATRARHDVTFTITRDAGRFDCEGYLADGRGAGVFTFTPDPAFAREMAELGFGGIDEDEQLAMALHDVSLAFAREIGSENLTGMETDKLIAFRIFDVSQQFVRELREAGLTAMDADKLVAFRVHGVSPTTVRALRNAGIDADEDELIAFQIHGVSPELVAELGRLGYADVEPDELVAMRIHGVTPEFIESLRSRGLEDLSIDKLVALRIHGID